MRWRRSGECVKTPAGNTIFPATALSTSTPQHRPLDQMSMMTLTDRLVMTRADHLASTVQLTNCPPGKRSACACVGAELALRITSELGRTRSTRQSSSHGRNANSYSRPDYGELLRAAEQFRLGRLADADFALRRQSSCPPELATATWWVYLQFRNICDPQKGWFHGTEGSGASRR